MPDRHAGDPVHLIRLRLSVSRAKPQAEDGEIEMTIPATHPRAKSLQLRERLVEGLHAGLVTESGLIAHGRGEALDYLLGERTHPFAHQAIAAASAHLLLARHPVLSINGNAAALAAEQFVALSREDPRLLLE